MTQKEPREGTTSAQVAFAVLVCGGRTYSDIDAVYRTLRRLSPVLVIHGQASGADKIADSWAWDNGVTVVRVPALWDAYGKGAGPRRNRAMLQLLRAVERAYLMRVAVVAFPGGRGTDGMCAMARDAGVEVLRAPCAATLLEVTQ